VWQVQGRRQGQHLGGPKSSSQGNEVGSMTSPGRGSKYEVSQKLKICRGVYA